MLLKKFENASSQSDPLDFLIKTTHTIGPFDPRTQYEEWWLLSAINQFCGYYSHSTLNHSTSWSEMDFVTKVWSILDHAFEDLKVFAGR